MSGRKFNFLHGAAAKKFTKELTRNLVEYNRSVGPPEEWQELVISVEADDTAALGGLAGYTHWKWLFVEHLWVEVTARRKGIGAQLLAKAEQTARERGCLGSWLDTCLFLARLRRLRAVQYVVRHLAVHRSRCKRRRDSSP
jgi:GNAT superfamily N-acetyltransferase